MCQEHGIDSVGGYNYLKKNNLNWAGNDSTIAAKELFNKVTYSVEEIVDHIYVRFVTSDENHSAFTRILGGDLERKLMRTHGHRKYGKCFQYHPEESITMLGVYYIKIVM